MDGEELGPAAAYSAQVAAWLNQAYHAQMIQIGFPSFLAYQASIGRFSPSGQTSPPAQSSPTVTPPRPQNINLTVPGVQTIPVIRATIIQGTDIFTIPPIWKRVVAEALDFLILFVLKVMITFIAVDFFEMVDLDQYEMPLDLLSNLDPDNLKIDYTLAFQFTQEILVLELVHRLVVCIFEALCTHRGPLGMPGGATPGKVIMGLKIIKADQVLSLGINRIRVVPGSDLGIFWATVRSVLKNFSVAFFFPVCFSLLFLPHSRTLYDILGRSVVVENNYRINRQINR